MRRWRLLLLAGLIVAGGCTQDFGAFQVGGSGGSGGPFPDASSGAGGKDASTKDSTAEDVQDASDAPSDGPIEAGCATGSKECNGACVLDTNPAFGCASASCDACAFSNASAACSTTGACAINKCSAGYSDCNNDAADGCEANLQSDPNNCGACGTVCVTPNATPKCVAGKCAVGSCNSGYADCDDDATNGCETDVNDDPTACGSCNNDCTKTDAGTSWTCSSGTCKLSSCPTGKQDCDGNPNNGCETNLDTDPNNCGFCGNKCNLANATATCTNGQCAVATCNAGYANCDNNPANGCEVNLNTSSVNCGACGRTCSNQGASSVSCSGGVCTPTCSAGYDNCNQPPVSQPDDGCETNVLNSPANCGACGRACSNAHTSGLVCAQGRCTPNCTNGYGDCTEPLAPAQDDGCETNTGSDPLNCGSCNRACSHQNATSVSCTAGACAPTCASGYADCSHPSADDGCETSVGFDVNNCGACGRKCSTTQASSVHCDLGVCDSLCNPGYGNCTQPAAPAPDDGCETDTNTDVDNCGSCSRPCSTAETNQVLCSAGLCTSTCQANYGNCNQPAAPAIDDGCEADLQTDASHCGACARPCSGAHASSTQCTGGTCHPTCVNGYGDCDDPTAPTADDGCETNVTDNPLHCGACGRACSTTNVAALSCSGSTCNSTCAAGYANCSQPTAPTADDGCETVQDGTHCGSACGGCSDGQACESAGVCECTSNGQCDDGHCNGSHHCTNFTGSTTCQFGETYTNSNGGKCQCNGGSPCGGAQICCPGTGCVDPTSSAGNCGACGFACPPGFACAASACACQTNANCNAGSGGTCTGSVCVCGATTCAVGQRCLSNGQCG
jgi:hypothetical protein